MPESVGQSLTQRSQARGHASGLVPIPRTSAPASTALAGSERSCAPVAATAIALFRHHGRGAATLSVALNSNTLNVAFGLLLPAAVVGVHAATTGATLTAAWYCGITVLALALAYAGRGLDWRAGIVIVIVYLAFVATLIAI